MSSLVIVGLTYAFPSLDDLWVENPFWNGLSKVYSQIDPVRLDDITTLYSLLEDPSNATVLLLGPSKPFSVDDVKVIEWFLINGGHVVLTDDFGTGNMLLEGLGLDVRFSQKLLMDALFKDKSSVMPRVLNLTFSGVHVQELTLNYPTTLENTTNTSVVAYSSSFSYTADTPGTPTEDSPVGPFPLVAEVSLGDGSLVLISDSSLFINSMLERAGNQGFLKGILEGQIVIDETHSMPSRLTLVKIFFMQVYNLLKKPEIKYGLTIACVFAIYNVNWNDGKSVEAEDEVERVLRQHPEWDRELLEQLHEERRRVWQVE